MKDLKNDPTLAICFLFIRELTLYNPMFLGINIKHHCLPIGD